MTTYVLMVFMFGVGSTSAHFYTERACLAAMDIVVKDNKDRELKAYCFEE